MPVMHRTIVPLAITVLQQMGKLMAAGMGQKVQYTHLTSKMAPTPDFPSRYPALGGFRTMLGGNHPRAIGDQMLLLDWIVTVIGGLAGPYPQCQRYTPVLLPHPGLGGRPQDVAGGLAHESADGSGG